MAYNLICIYKYIYIYCIYNIVLCISDIDRPTISLHKTSYDFISLTTNLSMSTRQTSVQSSEPVHGSLASKSCCLFYALTIQVSPWSKDANWHKRQQCPAKGGCSSMVADYSMFHLKRPLVLGILGILTWSPGALACALI